MLNLDLGFIIGWAVRPVNGRHLTIKGARSWFHADDRRDGHLRDIR